MYEFSKYNFHTGPMDFGRIFDENLCILRRFWGFFGRFYEKSAFFVKIFAKKFGG